MLRRLLQPIWVLLAVIFLIEAWLWDHLEPIVAWVVAKIPLRAFKHWLAERVDTLSPAMTLVVFVVPVIPLFPLKLVGFWLLTHEYWMSAIFTIMFAKSRGIWRFRRGSGADLPCPSDPLGSGEGSRACSWQTRDPYVIVFGGSRTGMTPMLRRLLQPIWVLLAVIFLIEAWLWDHLEPIVAWVVAKIPLRAFKHWLAERVDTLSPAMTLVVFIVPVIPLFPLKLVGFWLLTHEYWTSAVFTILFAKFLGVGVTAFVFDVTRSKLLEMGWFETLYEFVMSMRAKAAALVEPIKQRICICCAATATAGHRGCCG